MMDTDLRDDHAKAADRWAAIQRLVSKHGLERLKEDDDDMSMNIHWFNPKTRQVVGVNYLWGSFHIPKRDICLELADINDIAVSVRTDGPTDWLYDPLIV